MPDTTPTMRGPHQGQAPLHAGPPLKEARGVVILVHGRGGNARDILSLAEAFAQAELAYLAPQATGNSWYPESFLAPMARNEPGLSSGLAAIEACLARAQAAGLAPERVFIGGFSQGACLALEFVARHARRYGGAFGFSGGLIGPENTPRDYAGSLDGTPVFLGCSDRDAHIPLARVEETTRVLGALGGEVTERIYPGMGHTINQDEIDHVVAMMARLGEQDRGARP